MPESWSLFENQVGKLHNFVHQDFKYLPKLNFKVYALTHEPTGARLLHVENEDPNNVFAIGFPTFPQDSTGVAHILEHVVLSGSKKYPVPDAFFSMIKRSMQTFMNAFTSNDWTMYPFSTQIEQDYLNLLDVYLDAVFFPRLTEYSFLQEGHRLQFNEKQELEFHGVVFNEMKGAMSDPRSVLELRLLQALFPTITYGNNFAGEPADIVDLSLTALRKFHQQHYHPSNAWVYSYGNLPPTTSLAKLDRVLSQFEAATVVPPEPAEKRFLKPQQFAFPYPIDPKKLDGQNHQVVLAWLTCSNQDSATVLGLSLLEQILLGDAAAPMRKALINSGLGKALADVSGYSDENKETYFALGLQGVAAENLDAVESLILEEIRLFCGKDYLDLELVESALHQIEFSAKEISGNPYGLSLLGRFFGSWIHGGDPIQDLDFNRQLAELKKQLTDPKFLQNLAQTQLLDNAHRVRLILEPDPECDKRVEQTLQQKLAKLQRNLTDSQTQKIVEQNQKLEALQTEMPDLTCLPKLEISSIPLDLAQISCTESLVEGINYVCYPQHTNGLVYVDLHFQLPELTTEQRITLPLLGYLLPKVGTANKNYEELSKQITRWTGGLASGPQFLAHVKEFETFLDHFTFSASALAENMQPLVDLCLEVLTEFNFNKTEYASKLIQQRAVKSQNSILADGSQHAIQLAQRKLNSACDVQQQYTGIEQIHWQNGLAGSDFETQKKSLTELSKLGKTLFSMHGLTVVLVAEQSALPKFQQAWQKALVNLPIQAERPSSKQASIETEFNQEIWTTTTPVSYVAQSFAVPNFSDSAAPCLAVIANLLKMSYLHREIREKGGAYGSLAVYDNERGVFSLASYRDPNLAKTLQVFEQAINWLQKGEFTEEETEEAVLMTLGSIDRPKSPMMNAATDYCARLQGKSWQARQDYRQQVLKISKPKLVEMARYFSGQSSACAAITNPEVYARDKALLHQENSFSIKKI